MSAGCPRCDWPLDKIGPSSACPRCMTQALPLGDLDLALYGASFRMNGERIAPDCVFTIGPDTALTDGQGNRIGDVLDVRADDVGLSVVAEWWPQPPVTLLLFSEPWRAGLCYARQMNIVFALLKLAPRHMAQMLIYLSLLRNAYEWWLRHPDPVVIRRG